MDRKLPCDKHEEQIKTLFKRVDGMENKIDDMTEMKIAINTISMSMEHIVEHNTRQDELNSRQNETLDKINENLNELNEGQRTLNNKVEKLEKRVDENENKHFIDTRDIEKEKHINVLKKYGVPFSVGIAIGTFLLKLFEVLK